jgi:DNA-binding transcriptional MerR regulator
MSQIDIIPRLCRKLAPVMRFAPLEGGESFTIGQLSAHLGVSLRTLRFYEQAGLLAPGRDGQQRRYTLADVERLRIIVTLRELEMSLAAIRELFRTIDLAGPKAGEEIEVTIAATLGTLLDDNRSRIAELEAINRRISGVNGDLVHG